MEILDLVQRHIPELKKKTAKEWAGPCPECGGEDRFLVWTHRDAWHCRGACNTSGDAIGFLRRYVGLTCPDAHERLGLFCLSTSCEVLDKCRLGRAQNGGSRPAAKPKALAPIARKTERTWQPSAADSPRGIWQQKAAKLVEVAHQALLENQVELDYLAGRGLPLEAVKKYRLGYIEKDFWRDRESWGLEAEYKENRQKKKLWFPRGILIPFFEAAQVLRVRIRRPEGEPRYYWLPGSGNGTFLLGEKRQAYLVVESDLDGLLVDWSAGDLVGVASMGNTTARPKSDAAEHLSQAIHIGLAFDVDQPDQHGKRPGAVAAAWWLEHYPQAERWPAALGKDPGEAYENGLDIRAWVAAGLPPVLRLPAPVAYAARVARPADQVLDYSERTSSSGKRYLLCQRWEVKERLAEQFPETAVFLPHEIKALAGMEPEPAELFLDIQGIFGGDIELTRITNGGNDGKAL